MPRGSISGQGRIQVRPPADWGMAAPDSVVIIEEPESDQARVNDSDREKRKRVRGWRSKLAEIIDPD